VSRIKIFTVFVALVLSSAHAFAADYPNAPVRIIFPFTAGGGGDSLIRRLAEGLSQRLNARFVVENKPGAGGAIASAFVAKSPPDGYTLLSVLPSLVTAPQLQANAGYDAIKDFTAVASILVVSPILVVGADSSAKTMKEFIASVKKSPGSVSLGNSGTGGPGHLPALLLEKAAGLKFLLVPYKGENQILPDVLGRQVSGMFVSVFTALPHVSTGKLRALAVASAIRIPALPDVPTMDELGLNGAQYQGWVGIVAPRGTPQSIINLLNREISAFSNNSEFKAELAVRGSQIHTGTPAAFDEMIRRDNDRFGQVIRDLGLKPE
jgi:tripartite-type tricarboxylate transporter receptor subunit TctC